MAAPVLITNQAVLSTTTTPAAPAPSSGAPARQPPARASAAPRAPSVAARRAKRTRRPPATYGHKQAAESTAATPTSSSWSSSSAAAGAAVNPAPTTPTATAKLLASKTQKRSAGASASSRFVCCNCGISCVSSTVLKAHEATHLVAHESPVPGGGVAQPIEASRHKRSRAGSSSDASVRGTNSDTKPQRSKGTGRQRHNSGSGGGGSRRGATPPTRRRTLSAGSATPTAPSGKSRRRTPSGGAGGGGGVGAAGASRTGLHVRFTPAPRNLHCSNGAQKAQIQVTHNGSSAFTVTFRCPKPRPGLIPEFSEEQIRAAKLQFLMMWLPWLEGTLPAQFAAFKAEFESTYRAHGHDKGIERLVEKQARLLQRKVIDSPPELFRSPEGMRRFVAEAKSCAADAAGLGGGGGGGGSSEGSSSGGSSPATVQGGSSGGSGSNSSGSGSSSSSSSTPNGSPPAAEDTPGDVEVLEGWEPHWPSPAMVHAQPSRTGPSRRRSSGGGGGKSRHRSGSRSRAAKGVKAEAGAGRATTHGDPSSTAASAAAAAGPTPPAVGLVDGVPSSGAGGGAGGGGGGYESDPGPGAAARLEQSQQRMQMNLRGGWGYKARLSRAAAVAGLPRVQGGAPEEGDVDGGDGSATAMHVWHQPAPGNLRRRVQSMSGVSLLGLVATASPRTLLQHRKQEEDEVDVAHALIMMG